MDDKVDDKIVDRIRKLFALATSPNEAEAALAMAKAHEMLKQYNLALADVQGGEKPDVQQVVVERGGKFSGWRADLLDAVARSNYCCMTWCSMRGSYAMRLFGREANVAVAQETFAYLAETVERLGRKAGNYRGVNADSYRRGMVQRLSERLRAMMIQENKECTALVPVASEAHEAAKAAFPKLKTASTGSGSDVFSAARGYRDGDNVSLNRQLKDEGGSDAQITRDH